MRTDRELRAKTLLTNTMSVKWQQFLGSALVDDVIYIACQRFSRYKSGVKDGETTKDMFGKVATTVNEKNKRIHKKIGVRNHIKFLCDEMLNDDAFPDVNNREPELIKELFINAYLLMLVSYDKRLMEGRVPNGFFKEKKGA